MNVPIFSQQKKHLSTTEIIETLLDPDLDRNVVATTQPVGVENNAIFIVDLKYIPRILCVMSWVHGETTVVLAFGLLLMLMESQKHGGKSSQVLPAMAVFRTKCVKDTTSTRRAQTFDG